ncbi:DUF3795 domain-containing protein [Candidatus Bipolaricaulota bacterium]|nr:DUF3795 domain-containing protein [Candidatus Bipolaricaulota bacterium]
MKSAGFWRRGYVLSAAAYQGAIQKAPEKLEKFKEAMGHPCMILECAIGKQVDHCTRCDQFPCEVHYKQEIYSHKLLNMIKGMLGKE